MFATTSTPKGQRFSQARHSTHSARLVCEERVVLAHRLGDKALRLREVQELRHGATSIPFGQGAQ